MRLRERVFHLLKGKYKMQAAGNQLLEHVVYQMPSGYLLEKN